MIANLPDIVITGLILGGIYALVAVGLSLQYGVGRVLNVSHGEFIMLGAFATFSLFTKYEINPLLAIGLIAPALFVLGYLVHQIFFQYLRSTSPSSDVFSARSLLASFGLLFVVQNLILIAWGPSLKGYTYLNSPVSIFGASYSKNRLVALFVSVGVSVIFYLFISRTRLGKAIRAAAEDPTMANVVGVNIHQVLGICFGLGTMLAGLAGVLISLMFQLQSAMSLEYTIIAIVVVVFGGLGSITGSLIGGFALGLVISVVNFYDPSLSLISFYAIFMLLLLVKPSGILGRQIDESH
ncbi:MAG: branched-chain amino acid ABC transporter permease [Anaerolineae bacterium]|nr:branched-chain amino acid ABC transporter permease [Anaerolineae bacterium]